MSEQKNFSENVEVAGNQLVERFKEIVQEGNVRRLIIKDSEGKSLVEIPLTAGVVVGGAVAIFSPWLAMLGALGGLVAKLTIEIVREEPQATIQDAENTIDDISNKLSS